MALPITITDAGRAEIINAQNTGTGPVTITEIGFGTGQYTPTKTRTALQAQVKRVSSIAGQAVAADTIHVMALDESSDAYNVGEFGLFSDKGTLIAVYSQPAASGWIIQKAGASTLLLATDIILESLNATNITFGDISFINPPATTTVQGVVELATPEETQAGNDGSRAVTPAGLKSLTASTSRAGLVQLNNTLTSSSTSHALTAAQGKKLQDEKQPLDTTLTALAALVTAANKLIYATGVDTFALADLTAFARTLLDDADAAAARATLELIKQTTSTDTTAGRVMTVGAFGLGDGVAAFDPSSVNLIDQPTGGAYSIVGPGNPFPEAAPIWNVKGTRSFAIAARANRAWVYTYGQTPELMELFHSRNVSTFIQTLLDDVDAAAARATLGAQAADATLSALAGLNTAANQLIYSTGNDQFAMAALSAFARTLLDDVDAAAARATLGAQAADATLSALAGLNTAANQLIYSTGADQFAMTSLSAFARTLIDDTDAAAARETLGLVKQVNGTDSTTGALLTVGAFGWGGDVGDIGADSITSRPTGAYYQGGFPENIFGVAGPMLNIRGNRSFALHARARRAQIYTYGETPVLMELYHNQNLAEATKEEAEAGTASGSIWMSPLRVFQSIRSATASATEALRGVLRVGTQAEVNAGSRDDAAVTPKKLLFGVSYNRAANGYLCLPSWLGGIVIQWGREVDDGNEKLFPIAFPTACLGLYGNRDQDSFGGGHVTTFITSPTSFRVREGDGVTPSVYIRWFAIGY